MSLKKLKTQDWDATFPYAPPTVDTVINTDQIVSAVVCDSRGPGPWYRIMLTTGASFIAKGNPSDLLEDN